jgi:hypothetical protein
MITVRSTVILFLFFTITNCRFQPGYSGTKNPFNFDIGLATTKEVNEITMFADNLGAIPPNTALMVVTDGKSVTRSGWPAAWKKMRHEDQTKKDR